LKIRIRFRKYSLMKYIGHLDVMRYFQKSMRRGDIDIKYSEGFSPHQIMSFAAPLGVGVTSDGEYLDIEVNSTESSKKSIEKLNAVMVEGIDIVSYRKLSDNEKNAMSVVACADYNVFAKDSAQSLDFDTVVAAKKEFYDDASEILVTKQTKKSEKVMDLKNLVYDFNVSLEDGNVIYYVKVCTGSTDNVKPELFLEAFFKFMGKEYDDKAYQIHRLDVYCMQDEKLISLSETGEEIE